MRYYVSVRAEQVDGPFESTELREKLASREIDWNTQTCPEGSQTWQPLAQIEEFTASAPRVLPGAPRPLSEEQIAQARMSLVGPILVTVFCCVIGGVVSIVYAAQANTAAAVGDLPTALKARSTAQVWMWVSFAIGLVVTLVYVGAAIASAVAGY